MAIDWLYQRAVVTGGAGFIGSHIVDALVQRGVHTVSLDNYSSGSRANLAHLQGNPLFEEVCIDILDPSAALSSRFDGADMVFHNAASKKVVCDDDPEQDLATNIRGTLHMLQLARAHKVKKFVHASTGSVYGQPMQWPQTENHPTNPTTFYGASKLAAEKYVALFHKLYGMDTTVLRYFHVYGPRQERCKGAGVVSIWINRLLDGQPPIVYGDGTQQRQFTYVGDIVGANLAVATNPLCTGRVYNCAGPKAWRLNDLLYLLKLKMPEQFQEPIYEAWRLGEVAEFDVDVQKLAHDGWQSFTDLYDGLGQTIRYLTGARELADT